MSLANAVNIVAFKRHRHEFKEFFDGSGNCLNSVLTFLFCFILFVFGITRLDSLLLVPDSLHLTRACATQGEQDRDVGRGG